MNTRLVLLIGLAICCFGPSACKPTASNPQTLAPGYLNSQDQTMGTALAALNAFANQEKVNFAALPPDKQAVERPYLNDLIAAVNLADQAYTNYHGSTMTAAQAQNAINAAQQSQAKLVAQKEAH